MTNTKPDLKEIVYEHGFDQILDAEMVELTDLAVDYNIDLDALIQENSNAAQAVVTEFKTHATASTKGPFARSLEKHLLTHEEKVLLLERLIKTAKKIGLSCTFSLKDILLFDEVALDFHIAEFQSLLDENDHQKDIS